MICKENMIKVAWSWPAGCIYLIEIQCDEDVGIAIKPYVVSRRERYASLQGCGKEQAILFWLALNYAVLDYG